MFAGCTETKGEDQVLRNRQGGKITTTEDIKAFIGNLNRTTAKKVAAIVKRWREGK